MREHDPLEPVAIIGLGGIFPGAAGIPGYWENIVGRKDCISEVPADRWDWRLYYDADPSAVDKTYSKIGGFVRDFRFDPLKLRIPPPVAAQMDPVQKMAVAATAEALQDAGFDRKPCDPERTAVILGNSMGGPKKDMTDLRVYAALFEQQLAASPAFSKLPSETRQALLKDMSTGVKAGLSTITEDTMPGELSNVIAGRVANVFNFNGANFTVDAACASSLAAIDQAVNGLRFGEYDTVLCGGVDQMMSPPAYVKFCKIGALSPDGSRPFDAGANGFVMGEGVGVMVLKRLSDALRDDDRVYALVRSVGSSSDGRGKGITAPNPKGQRLAIERCFNQLEYGPGEVGLLEAHGTSTKVGDVVEVSVAQELFGPHAKRRSIGLGSVKSQIGHLKAAAGIAALVKTALALKHRTLPPSINFRTPNPGVDWEKSPFFVVTEAREWASQGPRRANVSSFGFGGTNFHVAMEEATSETVARWERSAAAKALRPGQTPPSTSAAAPEASAPQTLPLSIVNMSPSLGGEALIVHGATPDAVFDRLQALSARLPADEAPLSPLAHETNAHSKTGEFCLAFPMEAGAKGREKVAFVLKSRKPDLWEATPPLFKAKGIYAGRRKKPGKVGFLFPGQGSQYVDMLKDLREKYRAVADTFAEADAIMEPLIGEKFTDILFTKGGETPERLAHMEERIKQTEITQPAVLTADVAILRLLADYGLKPDVVCGHSLGEYGALVAAGVMSFKDALLAVSARGKEMAGVKVKDNGKMASVAAPVERVEPILKEVDGYVVAANKNCPSQTVIAGETRAVEAAVKKFGSLGLQAQEIRVSHAFHSQIVAPAQASYARFLDRLSLSAPRIPLLSNVTAAYYPEDAAGIKKLMVEQIASPVEFIRQVERMYQDGVRIFVEVGPKRVLTAFVTSTLEGRKDAVAVSSNHPKRGGILEFNDLLSRLSAESVELKLGDKDPLASDHYTPQYRAWAAPRTAPARSAPGETRPSPAESDLQAKWDFYTGPVVVSGVAAGTPGAWDRVFKEDSLDQILRGQNLIGRLSETDLERQLDKNIVKLIKSPTGDHRLERIQNAAEVVHLAALAGEFDLAREFGFKEAVAGSMDVSSRLAVAAGLLALRDAGLPLVPAYKETTTGSLLQTGWLLPEALREETGVIFASAYPSIDSMASEVARYLADKFKRRPLKELAVLVESLISRLKDANDRTAVQHWYATTFQSFMERHGDQGPYEFSREFLLRVMPLGHSQLMQWIGARGPALHMSAACASTTEAVALAEDWIRLGRAKRVIVIAGDDVTGPALREWMTTGFLASGAATTTAVVSEAALPFDRRRHGMILGMGAAALVIEQGSCVTGRGMRALTEVLAGQYENSAFHVTRLSLDHVASVMKRLLAKVEKRWGISRRTIASKCLFMSHETYTPARGGSAAAEVRALKEAFGADASRIVVANTKGFHGHSMGASIEDPIAVKALVTGLVPPIANYKETDPELSGITLSRGGEYDLEYALRLGAGFGSQIAMTLMRRVLRKGEARIADPSLHRDWLKRMTGQSDPQLEVVHNTLRVKAGKIAPVPAAPAAAPAIPVAGDAVGSAAAARLSTGRRPMPVSETPRPGDAGATAQSEANVRATVVALVSEKTGYPAEMLELDLDMEADLGIDTVKQAEMFGMIRERFGIPQRENISLKEYPTLRHVIRFVLEGGGSAVAEPAETPPASVTPSRGVSETGIGLRPGESRGAGTGPTPSPASGSPDAGGALDADSVREAVVALVSEKTGYPAEMLELDLDMEADLGIDTVKQAEMFAVLRERFGIPRQENLALKDYPTLRHLIRFIREGSTGTTAASAPATAAPAAMPTALFKRWALEAYERPLPTASKPLSKDPVVLLGDAAAAKPFIQAFKDHGIKAVLVAKPQDAAKAGPTQGLISLSGLSLEDLKAAAPKAFDQTYKSGVSGLFLAAKALQKELDRPGGWVLVLTRMGGRHQEPSHPLAGALTGLAKALRHELPKARVLSMDFEAKASPAACAKACLEELACADRVLEVGRAGGKRWALRLAPRKAGPQALRLGAKPVVLVTGGGQGLGAECSKEIARRWKPRLVILGRTALDMKASEWAALDSQGLSALKQRLWEGLKADTARKATPAVLEKEFSKVTKAAALWRSLEAMRRAGAEVHYETADLADEASVSQALGRLEKPLRAPDIVLHAAGLEESKLLADKTPERFDAVFRAKAHGAIFLLRQLAAKPGQSWLFFSSVVGRFGNLGQTDYAAASDFLPKLACWIRSRGGKAAAVDLTAISEIGMATRGGVEQFLKSQGVDFMPPAVAVSMILDEVEAGLPDAEVVLAGSLGKMDQDGLMQAGGPDPMPRSAETGSRRHAPLVPGPRFPESSEVARAPGRSAPEASGPARPLFESILRREPELVTVKEFSLEKDPWLKDHSIAGIPYVAGVMGLELFAETVAEATGKLPAGLEDVRFSLPIKLLRNKPVTVRTFYKDGALHIESDFFTPQGIKLGGPRTHFTAKVLTSGGEAPAVKPHPAGDAPIVTAEAIYSAYFHGPSFQVLSGITRISENELTARVRPPPAPLWKDGGRRLSFHPMHLEAAFQACGYRDLHFAKRMTLPDSIGRVRVWDSIGDGPLSVLARHKGADKQGRSVYDAWVVDALGLVLAALEDYRMVPVS